MTFFKFLGRDTTAGIARVVIHNIACRAKLTFLPLVYRSASLSLMQLAPRTAVLCEITRIGPTSATVPSKSCKVAEECQNRYFLGTRFFVGGVAY